MYLKFRNKYLNVKFEGKKYTKQHLPDEFELASVVVVGVVTAEVSVVFFVAAVVVIGVIVDVNGTDEDVVTLGLVVAAIVVLVGTDVLVVDMETIPYRITNNDRLKKPIHITVWNKARSLIDGNKNLNSTLCK